MLPLSRVVLVAINSKHWEPRIKTEYVDDLQFPKPRRFSLRAWVARGMRLLDPVHMPWPVRPGAIPALQVYQTLRRLSHEGGYVFILYGKYAEDYRGAIDENTNLVVTRGDRPFSRASDYLGLDRQRMWRQ